MLGLELSPSKGIHLSLHVFFRAQAVGGRVGCLAELNFLGVECRHGGGLHIIAFYERH